MPAKTVEVSRDNLVQHKLLHHLDRQILVPVSFSCLLSSLLQTPRKVRSYDRNVVSKSSYRLEEFAEQYEDAVDLDEEADQWPAEEDEYDACDKGCSALDLLAACEEEECALDSEEQGYAGQEEDLHGAVSVRIQWWVAVDARTFPIANLFVFD
jgi:hypothetical protein